MDEPDIVAEEEGDIKSDYEGDYLNGIETLDCTVASDPEQPQMEFV